VSTEEWLARLEDACCAALLYCTDNQPQRASRSLAASKQGDDLLDLFNTIKAERAPALVST